MDDLIWQIRDIERRMHEVNAELADERALAIERLIVREGGEAAAAAALGVTRQAVNRAFLRARALRTQGRPLGARSRPQPKLDPA